MVAHRKNLLAPAAALAVSLLCGAGVAQAQSYYDTESVIVSPNQRFDTIETQHLAGRVHGELNPTVMSISHPVSFAGLDLRRGADFRELQIRVSDTAQDLCATLDSRPGMRNSYENSECINNAIRNAMAQVPVTPAG